MSRFLILQLRPETEASDDEFAAILRKGGLESARAHRIRLDREPLPAGLSLGDYAGVIVGGGPACVSDARGGKSAIDQQVEAAILGLLPAITDADFPFMGCCYGIGILSHFLGAPVNKSRYAETVCAIDCTLTTEGTADPLLTDIPERFRAFVGHKEAVQALPAGCAHLASSKGCPFQMIRFGRNVYATQFHPEADSDGFAVRIRLYRDKGYFPPEDADRLVAMCRSEDVHVPERILKNFVAAYG